VPEQRSERGFVPLLEIDASAEVDREVTTAVFGAS
jgi:hypothetical protein